MYTAMATREARASLRVGDVKRETLGDRAMRRFQMKGRQSPGRPWAGDGVHVSQR